MLNGKSGQQEERFARPTARHPPAASNPTAFERVRAPPTTKGSGVTKKHGQGKKQQPTSAECRDDSYKSRKRRSAGDDSAADKTRKRKKGGDEAKKSNVDCDNPPLPTICKIASTVIAKSKVMRGVQHPIVRVRIWENLQEMFRVNGYTCVKHAPEPKETENMLPNNKGYISQFHVHGEKEGAPDVYVMFFSKLGGPTINSLKFPSTHMIFVYDTITTYGKNVIAALPTRSAATSETGSAPASKTDTAKPTASSADRKLSLEQLTQIQTFKSSMFAFRYLQARYVRDLDIEILDAKARECLVPFGIEPAASSSSSAGDSSTSESGESRAPLPIPVFERDPLAAYLNMQRGQIAHIRRLSTASAQCSSFRIFMPKNSSGR